MQNLHKSKNTFYDNLIKFKNDKFEYMHLQKCLDKINKNETLELDIKNSIEKFVTSKKYFSKF